MEALRLFDDSNERRWSGYIVPPPDNGWPTWAKVRAEMNPLVSDEECGWELGARIAEANRIKRGEHDTNIELPGM